MKSPFVSVLLPVYNEAKSISKLYTELKIALIDIDHELIFINDGSTDSSFIQIQKYARGAIIISLPHQGKWKALEQGYGHAHGNVIVTCDSDLQDDPKEMRRLLEYAKKYDVVSGWRKSRQDSLLKRIAAQLGSTVFGFHDMNSSLKLFKREVFEKLPKEKSLLRFSLYFAKRSGLKVIEVPVVHRRRKFGKSKFGVTKYVGILYDALRIQFL
ncbi:MAG TPA: glycosyltransferase [Patescibacteria group bacterium]|nr:glycosyltransferase [Patescibacteria group bacterium]